MWEMWNGLSTIDSSLNVGMYLSAKTVDFPSTLQKCYMYSFFVEGGGREGEKEWQGAEKRCVTLCT